MKRLYIFNPEHDLALAGGNANYQAPESALFLASDLATLPKWYAEQGGIVFDRSDLNPFSCDPATIESVEPWGWDPAVRRLLLANGIEESILPNDEEMKELRQLSHRRVATRAMNHLKSDIGDRWKLPAAGAELYSLDEVKEFAKTHGEVVLKAPWSSSGRGVYWTKEIMTPSMQGWIKRVIEKQGSIMGEVAMKRVQDFAMEFRVVDHKTEFVGYSLFFTEGTGAYRGNVLMSNERIEEELSRWIEKEQLDAVRKNLISFIDSVVAPIYSGCMGVDMFVYEDEDGFCLDPVVEINMRMTMGMVARVIYDKYVSKDSEGSFVVEHKLPGRLFVNHQWHERHEKMEYDSAGKMVHGYLSLCPVTPNTLYRASVNLERIENQFGS